MQPKNEETEKENNEINQEELNNIIRELNVSLQHCIEVSKYSNHRSRIIDKQIRSSLT